MQEITPFKTEERLFLTVDYKGLRFMAHYL